MLLVSSSSLRPLCALLLLITSDACAGSLNPDISAIGDMRARWAESEKDDVVLAFEELELSFVGPVNPYASAAVFIGAHGIDQFEIEEAKLMLDRYFPAGFGLTIGRSLIDFGQLNQVHAHAFPFVSRPLMHTAFFSEDGVIDDGVRIDWLAPVDAVTVRATGGVVRGDVFRQPDDHGHAKTAVDEDDSEAEEDARAKLGFTGRLEFFAERNETLALLIGASALHGTHDVHESAKVTWLNADVKAVFDLGPSRALILQAETVFGTLDATEEIPEASPNGWFASVDYRTGRRWNIGGFAESATARADEEARTNRFGGFVGLALMEESTLFRVVGHWTDPDSGESEAGVMLQTVFAIGPHAPHRF